MRLRDFDTRLSSRLWAFSFFQRCSGIGSALRASSYSRPVLSIPMYVRAYRLHRFPSPPCRVTMIHPALMSSTLYFWNVWALPMPSCLACSAVISRLPLFLPVNLSTNSISSARAPTESARYSGVAK